MKCAVVLLAVAIASQAIAREPAKMQILETRKGTRFGLFGKKPASPAATFFVFATSVDGMAKYRVYSETGRVLAGHGWLYVTLDPPCHGHDHRPAEPAELSGWAHRVNNGQDLTAGFVARCRDVLDWLIAEGYTDPSRVAAGGTSRGGFSALHFAAKEPRVGAVVCVSPVTNLLALREFAQVPPQKAARFHALTLADKLAGRAIWISIGNHDDRVSTDDCIATTRKFVATAIKRQPKMPAPVELIVAPTAGHTAVDSAYPLAAAFVLRYFPTSKQPAAKESP